MIIEFPGPDAAKKPRRKPDEPASVTHLRERREPFVMSHWFTQLAHLMARGRLLHTPTGFLVVLLNDEHIDVYHGGFKTWEDMHEAATAADDYILHEKHPSVSETATEARARRRAYRAEEAARREEYERTYPFMCPGCRSRFKTETGLKQHRTRSKRKHWMKGCHPTSP